MLYTSEILSKLWPFGLSSIGDVTFESAAYVARYVLKKVTGDAADSYYRSVDLSTGEISVRVPESAHMSLKPGIGAGWFEKYGSDVFPNDFVVSRETEAKPPRFYDKLLHLRDPTMLEDVKYSRYTKAMLRQDDNTDDRLVVKETVALAKLSNLPRVLE